MEKYTKIEKIGEGVQPCYWAALRGLPERGADVESQLEQEPMASSTERVVRLISLLKASRSTWLIEKRVRSVSLSLFAKPP